MLKQKPKMSSLNPHAKPYIPVQMQGGPQSSDFLSKARSGNKQEKDTPDLFVYGSEEQIAACISDGTISKYEDKEYLMDLIYLTVLFPSTPRQLLFDVYNLKNGNLGPTIEMLEKGYNGSKHSHTANETVHPKASTKLRL